MLSPNQPTSKKIHNEPFPIEALRTESCQVTSTYSFSFATYMIDIFNAVDATSSSEEMRKVT
jgi:hypothetical protein